MMEWRLVDTGKGDPYMNMAIDEAIAVSSRTETSSPTIRFYQWERPALTIGYFQPLKDEISIDLYRKEKVPIIRRITGGRSLLHQHELTYSIVSPTNNPIFPNNIRGAYLVIAKGLSAGLKILGIDSEIFQLRTHGDCSKKDRSFFCFSSPSMHEITVAGKKIIGSAQRRWSDIFLQQGSIIIERNTGLFMLGDRGIDVEYSTSIAEASGKKVAPLELKNALFCAFREELGIEFKEDNLTDLEKRLSEKLYLEKYTRDEWNMERRIP